jgi:hypothetical protein
VLAAARERRQIGAMKTWTLLAALPLGLLTGACGDDGKTPSDGNGAGAQSSSGGSGNSPGGAGNGAGAASSGGNQGAGAATSGGSGTGASGSGATGGSGGTADPDAAARVSGWIDQLPDYAHTNMGGNKDAIVDAVVKSCIEFAPPGDEWQIYCEAQLTASMLKESSYTPDLVVMDGYATREVEGQAGTDGTMGLLQVRFSSTVNDYNSFGPLDAMSRIGCEFPAFGHENDGGNSLFWTVTGPTDNLAFMHSIPCNIGLATWYYYYAATGNGAPPIYVYQYCNGEGVAADLVTGLLSHLRGPGGAKDEPTDSDPYVTEIKTWFDMFVGAVEPHPFRLPLSPNPGQYCR